LARELTDKAGEEAGEIPLGLADSDNSEITLRSSSLREERCGVACKAVCGGVDKLNLR